MLKKIERVLNLYAGLGGNALHWDGCQVTAVEYNQDIADIYQAQRPKDKVVVGDAHEYLLNHYQEYDFIWSSPPCQSHSKMHKAGRNRKPRFRDYKLYEEIEFLKEYHKGLWVVENVAPYYTPPIPPNIAIGRHRFWSNFLFMADEVKQPKDFINLATVSGSEKLKDWLGIQYEGNIYYTDTKTGKKNHCPAQVLRNCVHPDIGKQIFNQAKGLANKGG